MRRLRRRSPIYDLINGSSIIVDRLSAATFNTVDWTHRKPNLVGSSQLSELLYVDTHLQGRSLPLSANHSCMALSLGSQTG